ncbi:hypothetical protein CBR_g63123 [Chara braunii]|uniref:Uncharacterized protein n=1 Tax=Chara braunii TaxID=69332 RepID=A0A388K936_CHABU|nr:hypothetical protein CBR_g63123 [Chara braunii]|eukprot:GBG66541.1 hypothetical protein CBR_g63123 [Chara braunii]
MKPCDDCDEEQQQPVLGGGCGMEEVVLGGREGVSNNKLSVSLLPPVTDPMDTGQPSSSEKVVGVGSLSPKNEELAFGSASRSQSPLRPPLEAADAIIGEIINELAADLPSDSDDDDDDDGDGGGEEPRLHGASHREFKPGPPAALQGNSRRGLDAYDFVDSDEENGLDRRDEGGAKAAAPTAGRGGSSEKGGQGQCRMILQGTERLPERKTTLLYLPEGTGERSSLERGSDSEFGRWRGPGIGGRVHSTVFALPAMETFQGVRGPGRTEGCPGASSRTDGGWQGVTRAEDESPCAMSAKDSSNSEEVGEAPAWALTGRRKGRGRGGVIALSKLADSLAGGMASCSKWSKRSFSAESFKGAHGSEGSSHPVAMLDTDSQSQEYCDPYPIYRREENEGGLCDQRPRFTGELTNGGDPPSCSELCIPSGDAAGTISIHVEGDNTYSDGLNGSRGQGEAERSRSPSDSERKQEGSKRRAAILIDLNMPPLDDDSEKAAAVEDENGVNSEEKRSAATEERQEPDRVHGTVLLPEGVVGAGECGPSPQQLHDIDVYEQEDQTMKGCPLTQVHGPDSSGLMIRCSGAAEQREGVHAVGGGADVSGATRSREIDLNVVPVEMEDYKTMPCVVDATGKDAEEGSGREEEVLPSCVVNWQEAEAVALAVSVSELEVVGNILMIDRNTFTETEFQGLVEIGARIRTERREMEKDAFSYKRVDEEEDVVWDEALDKESDNDSDYDDLHTETIIAACHSYGTGRKWSADCIDEEQRHDGGNRWREGDKEVWKEDIAHDEDSDYDLHAEGTVPACQSYGAGSDKTRRKRTAGGTDEEEGRHEDGERWEEDVACVDGDKKGGIVSVLQQSMARTLASAGDASTYQQRIEEHEAPISSMEVFERKGVVAAECAKLTVIDSRQAELHGMSTMTPVSDARELTDQAILCGLDRKEVVDTGSCHKMAGMKRVDEGGAPGSEEGNEDKVVVCGPASKDGGAVEAEGPTFKRRKMGYVNHKGAFDIVDVAQGGNSDKRPDAGVWKGIHDGIRGESEHRRQGGVCPKYSVEASVSVVTPGGVDLCSVEEDKGREGQHHTSVGKCFSAVDHGMSSDQATAERLSTAEGQGCRHRGEGFVRERSFQNAMTDVDRADSSMAATSSVFGFTTASECVCAGNAKVRDSGRETLLEVVSPEKAGKSGGACGCVEDSWVLTGEPSAIYCPRCTKDDMHVCDRNHARERPREKNVESVLEERHQSEGGRKRGRDDEMSGGESRSWVFTGEDPSATHCHGCGEDGVRASDCDHARGRSNPKEENAESVPEKRHQSNGERKKGRDGEMSGGESRIEEKGPCIGESVTDNISDKRRAGCSKRKESLGKFDPGNWSTPMMRALLSGKVEVPSLSPASRWLGGWSTSPGSMKQVRRRFDQTEVNNTFDSSLRISHQLTFDTVLEGCGGTGGGEGVGGRGEGGDRESRQMQLRVSDRDDDQSAIAASSGTAGMHGRERDGAGHLTAVDSTDLESGSGSIASNHHLVAEEEKGSRYHGAVLPTGRWQCDGSSQYGFRSHYSLQPAAAPGRPTSPPLSREPVGSSLPHKGASSGQLLSSLPPKPIIPVPRFIGSLNLESPLTTTRLGRCGGSPPPQTSSKSVSGCAFVIEKGGVHWSANDSVVDETVVVRRQDFGRNTTRNDYVYASPVVDDARVPGPKMQTFQPRVQKCLGRNAAPDTHEDHHSADQENHYHFDTLLNPVTVLSQVLSVDQLQVPGPLTPAGQVHAIAQSPECDPITDASDLGECRDRHTSSLRGCSSKGMWETHLQKVDGELRGEDLLRTSQRAQTGKLWCTSDSTAEEGQAIRLNTKTRVGQEFDEGQGISEDKRVLGVHWADHGSEPKGSGVPWADYGSEPRGLGLGQVKPIVSRLVQGSGQEPKEPAHLSCVRKQAADGKEMSGDPVGNQVCHDRGPCLADKARVGNSESSMMRKSMTCTVPKRTAEHTSKCAGKISVPICAELEAKEHQNTVHKLKSSYRKIEILDDDNEDEEHCKGTCTRVEVPASGMVVSEQGACQAMCRGSKEVDRTGKGKYRKVNFLVNGDVDDGERSSNRAEHVTDRVRARFGNGKRCSDRAPDDSPDGVKGRRGGKVVLENNHHSSSAGIRKKEAAEACNEKDCASRTKVNDMDEKHCVRNSKVRRSGGDRNPICAVRALGKGSAAFGALQHKQCMEVADQPGKPDRSKSKKGGRRERERHARSGDMTCSPQLAGLVIALPTTSLITVTKRELASSQKTISSGNCGGGDGGRVGESANLVVHGMLREGEGLHTLDNEHDACHYERDRSVRHGYLLECQAEDALPGPQTALVHDQKMGGNWVKMLSGQDVGMGEKLLKPPATQDDGMSEKWAKLSSGQVEDTSDKWEQMSTAQNERMDEKRVNPSSGQDSGMYEKWVKSSDAQDEGMGKKWLKPSSDQHEGLIAVQCSNGNLTGQMGDEALEDGKDRHCDSNHKAGHHGIVGDALESGIKGVDSGDGAGGDGGDGGDGDVDGDGHEDCDSDDRGVDVPVVDGSDVCKDKDAAEEMEEEEKGERMKGFGYQDEREIHTHANRWGRRRRRGLNCVHSVYDCASEARHGHLSIGADEFAAVDCHTGQEIDSRQWLMVKKWRRGLGEEARNGVAAQREGLVIGLPARLAFAKTPDVSGACLVECIKSSGAEGAEGENFADYMTATDDGFQHEIGHEKHATLWVEGGQRCRHRTVNANWETRDGEGGGPGRQSGGEEERVGKDNGHRRRLLVEGVDDNRLQPAMSQVVCYRHQVAASQEVGNRLQVRMSQELGGGEGGEQIDNLLADRKEARLGGGGEDWRRREVLKDVSGARLQEVTSQGVRARRRGEQTRQADKCSPPGENVQHDGGNANACQCPAHENPVDGSPSGRVIGALAVGGGGAESGADIETIVTARGCKLRGSPAQAVSSRDVKSKRITRVYHRLSSKPVIIEDDDDDDDEHFAAACGGQPSPPQKSHDLSRLELLRSPLPKRVLVRSAFQNGGVRQSLAWSPAMVPRYSGVIRLIGFASAFGGLTFSATSHAVVSQARFSGVANLATIVRSLMSKEKRFEEASAGCFGEHRYGRWIQKGGTGVRDGWGVLWSWEWGGAERASQVLLTDYLRCLPVEVKTKLVDEAYVDQHNLASFSKKALDIEARLGSAHQSQGDGRKKRLPQDLKKKGKLIFVDHDGKTTKIEDFLDLGEETKHDGANEISDGGAMATIKERARGTGKKKVVRSTGQGDQGTPAWVKLGLDYEATDPGVDVIVRRVRMGAFSNARRVRHRGYFVYSLLCLTATAATSFYGIGSRYGMSMRFVKVKVNR